MKKAVMATVLVLLFLTVNGSLYLYKLDRENHWANNVMAFALEGNICSEPSTLS
jgi:hypothetical protein